MNKNEFLEYTNNVQEQHFQDLDAQNRYKQEINARDRKKSVTKAMQWYGWTDIQEEDFDEEGNLVIGNLTLAKSIHGDHTVFPVHAYCTKCNQRLKSHYQAIDSMLELGEALNIVCFECENPKPVKRTDLEIAKSYIQDENHRFWFYLVKSLVETIQNK